MAKANIRSNDQFELLRTGDYNLIIDMVEQSRRDDFSAPYAHVVFHEAGTGKRLDGNYTLGTEDDDSGVWAIVELFEAINGCSTNQSVDLMKHDFESYEDNMRLVGSAVIGHVWIDDGKSFDGRPRNKVGRIQAAVPVTVDEPELITA